MFECSLYQPRKSLEKWDVEEVCSWLRRNKLEDYSDVFKENKISGSTLLSSVKDGSLKIDLKDIGVMALGNYFPFLVIFYV